MDRLSLSKPATGYYRFGSNWRSDDGSRVGQKFPAVGTKKLLRILEHHCGKPIRTNGSHHFFMSPYTHRRVLLPVHPVEIWGKDVRNLLVAQLGLSVEAALAEVS